MEVHGAYKDDNSGLHALIPANYPDIYKLLREGASTSRSRRPAPATGFRS